MQLAAVSEAWNWLTVGGLVLTASCLHLLLPAKPGPAEAPEPELAPEPAPEPLPNVPRTRSKYRSYRLEQPIVLRNREAPTGDRYSWGQVEDWFQ